MSKLVTSDPLFVSGQASAPRRAGYRALTGPQERGSLGLCALTDMVQDKTFHP
jgi:hypothetical protein